MEKSNKLLQVMFDPPPTFATGKAGAALNAPKLKLQSFETMQNRILLYIDILGFSELVSSDTAKIDDLYEVIASLNAHHHDAFKCVIFSDTILIYNVDGGDTPADVSYLLMFQCEFVKDLMHRLTNRGIVFRAVITDGSFKHYQLNEVSCYYGNALIDAHESEKILRLSVFS